jgi:hypothetical protein
MLLVKLVSPVYTAVSVLVPPVENVNEQTPAVSTPVHFSPVLAVTVTLPVGIPLNCGVTLKLTVTICPMIAGLGRLDVIVVVVAALMTLTTPVG